MIYWLVYPVWIITFCLGYYTAEVATFCWGFPGRLAAYLVWTFGAMLTMLGPALMFHKQLGTDWSFSIGALVGTVFNILFFIAGLRLAVAKRKAWQKKWQQFNDEANRPT